jgi:diguanylate cyclase (GGDEF)-like protein
MNQKLAIISAIFSAFMITLFLIMVTDDLVGVRHLQIQEHITGYSYLVDLVVNYNVESDKRIFTDGLAIGGSFALGLTILFIYIANGRKTILLLSSYFLLRAVILTVLLGVNVTVFFPKLYQLQTIDIPVLVVISELFLLWFIALLFKLRQTHKKLLVLVKTICWLLLFYLPISLFLSIELSFHISVFIELMLNAMLLAVGVYLIKSAQRLAILYTVFIIIQLIFSSLNIVSLLWFNFDIYGAYPYLYTTSFWLSGCITVFTLSRGYYYQIQDKQIAELKALASLEKSKKAQAELLVLQEENQEQLESRVQERTLELNIALQELELANKELAEKNTLDELTGLYNRRYYDQKIIAEHRRSRRNLTPLSLVVIDIDHFKNVNDTHGHLAGDQCLVWVAKIIKQSLGRVTDLGCRYGGEEFCLILPETDTKGAIALAETLRLAIESETVPFQEIQIPLTISCGISTYWQQPDIMPPDIFAAADEALYSAKANGRNQVQNKSLTDTLKS